MTKDKKPKKDDGPLTQSDGVPPEPPPTPPPPPSNPKPIEDG